MFDFFVPLMSDNCQNGFSTKAYGYSFTLMKLHKET